MRKLVSVVYIVLVLLLGAATFVEQARGNAYASEHIYHSGWFCVLWGILVVASVAWIVRRRLWLRLPVFLIHVAFIIILGGAATSFLTSKEGQMHIRTGTAENMFYNPKEKQMELLPFALRLNAFNVEYYPGTEAPSDFVSRVSIVQERQKAGEKTISMNHILEHQGYRFYQSSFDSDHQGTILAVNYDPYGTPVTYFGYALLALAMMWTLLARGEQFRSLLRSPLLRRGLCLLLLIFPNTLLLSPLSTLLTPLSSLLTPNSSLLTPNSINARSIPTISREKADKTARMQVIYNDRVAPLNTLARDFTTKIYGRPTYKGLSAEQVVEGWLAKPEAWKNEKMIKIKDAQLRKQLGIEGKYASMADLFLPAHGAGGTGTGGYEYKLNRMETHSKPVRELDEKVGLILMLTNGTLIKPRPADVAPLSDLRVNAELLYNRIPFSKVLFMVNLTLGLLTFALLVWAASRQRQPRFGGLRVVLWGAFAFYLFGYVLRWYVGGRIPLGNGNETMQFLALAIMLTALLIGRRMPHVLPFGFLLSGFAMLVAWLGENNPQITPLMPVLSSPLLSAHVSLVMMSYALLAFTMLNGLFALILTAVRHHPAANTQQSTPNTQDPTPSAQLSLLLLYPAVFFLAAGIFLGAVWANVSWGRYWSWDPKEVWALITLMVYAVPLHRQSLPAFGRPMVLHAYLAAAFLAVLMTYFGVNYFLGGMHSYA